MASCNGEKVFIKGKTISEAQRIKYGNEGFDLTLSQWKAALNCNINGCLIAGNLNCSAMRKKMDLAFKKHVY